MVLVAIVFAAALFIQAAMAAHLPRLLEASGATHVAAVAAGALMGPAQVGARIIEYTVLRRISPLASARIAAALHPLGILVIGLLGAPAAAAFAILHGAGNGMMTIAKGMLPLALFGHAGYGLRTGVLSVPGRMLQASAPLVFGLVLDHFGASAGFILSGSFGVCALIALMMLRSLAKRD
jgi:hypothetical protein